MTPLSELRRLIAAASPGPWTAEEVTGGWLEVLGGDPADPEILFSVDAGQPEDAAVIVALVNSATEILDRLEAAERLCEAIDVWAKAVDDPDLSENFKDVEMWRVVDGVLNQWRETRRGWLCEQCGREVPFGSPVFAVDQEPYCSQSCLDAALRAEQEPE